MRNLPLSAHWSKNHRFLMGQFNRRPKSKENFAFGWNRNSGQTGCGSAGNADEPKCSGQTGSVGGVACPQSAPRAGQLLAHGRYGFSIVLRNFAQRKSLCKQCQHVSLAFCQQRSMPGCPQSNPCIGHACQLQRNYPPPGGVVSGRDGTLNGLKGSCACKASGIHNGA